MLWFRGALVEVVAAAGGRRGSPRTAGIVTTTFAAAAEQHQIVGHDFGHIFLLPRRLVVPRAGLQAALDVHLTALFQILTGNFGQPLPEHHVVPLGAVLPLAVFAL